MGALSFLLAFMLVFATFQAANSTAPEVVIRSLNYRDKIHPDEKFSVEVVFVCNDVNGWAKAKLYLREPEPKELKVSEGIWCGLFGKNAGENITVTLSDITLSPRAEPYTMEVTMFWQPVSMILGGEVRQESKSLEVTVVNIALSADCLPNSVNMNEVFTLQCSITNEGNGVARDTTVSIADSRDFSLKGESHEEIGDIEPGQPKSVSFNMSSPFAISSSVHSMVLRLTYTDWDNKQYATSQGVSIKVDVPPEALMDYWPRIALYGAIILVIVSFAVLGRKLIINRKGVTVVR
jgi:hypothetical protein